MKAARLQQKRDIEQAKLRLDQEQLHIRLQQEELKIEEEMAISKAKTKVLESFQKQETGSLHNKTVAKNRYISPSSNFGNSELGSAISNASEQAILSVVRHLRKPVSDIRKFGGNPLEYHKFFRQFKTVVVNNTEDDDERMNYLDQYTVGEANKIVSVYGYLEARIGYPAAMKELEERYGDVDVIVHAFITKALNWPTIKADNAKALDEFSVFPN